MSTRPADPAGRRVGALARTTDSPNMRRAAPLPRQPFHCRTAVRPIDQNCISNSAGSSPIPDSSSCAQAVKPEATIQVRCADDRG
ncbi:hypothetical protein Maq22A_c27995 [Methylobacterium aquaticum]|uniref:Uncharacterized protein n=1 Tax=Methylobacterium aquaticum TaxID=270351 RepID=A0A1Y0ZGL9_9HYPH|nr:hypothetical protein Maq22A_c27995 [Methylobacterium aquaticum]